MTPAGLAQSPSKSSNLRFRVSWGGGQNQSWHGALETESGRISNIVPLGLSESSTTTARATGDREISIRQTDASNYDGFDFTFDGEIESRIRINLWAKDGPDSPLLEAPSIASLIQTTFNRPLDDLGNRITITRIPSDDIRVNFEQDHLVMTPGQVLPVKIWTNHCRLKPTNANLNLSIVNARQSGPTLWSDSQRIEIDRTGNSLTKTKFQIDVPKTEGVYDLLIEVNQNWLGINQATQHPTVRALTSPKNTLSSRIQFVVVADRPAKDRSANDRPDSAFLTIGEISAEEIKPSGPNWRITSYKQKHSILGNQKSTLINDRGRPLIQLATGGWQAIRLPTLELGQPHMVEISYPENRPTALGISVLDQSPQGQVALRGADCGIQIPDSIAVGEGGPQIGRHRITFWPKSNVTYLLLANQSTYLPAQFGNIRVMAGPQSLRPTPNDTPRVLAMDAETVDSTSAKRQRLAWYQSPSFMDDFGVQKFFDPAVGQPLDDWVAFYQGTSRLIDYLKVHRYQGAVITVTADGSSIYPATLANNLPTHDSGVFLSNGQDPFRKDVLRMMLKMFARENLTLIPAFSFSHPLDQIEAMRDESQTPQSFDLVDQTQNLSPRSAQRPRYNPLDLNVQMAVLEILDTFLNRYQRFDSLGGLSLNCQSDTYTLLPGSKWGHDRHTASRFQASLPPSSGDKSESLSDQTDSPHTEQQWLQWRSDQMTSWYQSIASLLEQRVPNGHLFIAPLGLQRSEESFSALCPNLHASVSFEQLMQNYGLDKTRLMADRRIVVLNSQSSPTAETLSASRVEINSIESHRVNSFFAKAAQPGTLFQHQGLWAHFAQLQSTPPFDQQSGRLMRRLRLSPSGLWNRQRFVSAIRHQDSFFLIDGGQGLPQGQEASVSNLSTTFARLPRVGFADVPYRRHDTASASDQSLVVRQATCEGNTYLYAVNDSPWGATVTVDIGRQISETSQSSMLKPAEASYQNFSSPAYLPLSPLAGRITREPTATSSENRASENGTPNLLPRQSFDRQSNQITIDLPPFGLAAGKLTGDSATATQYDYQVDPNLGQSLRKKTYALQAKLNLAKKTRPLKALADPEFESERTNANTGWDIGDQSTDAVQFDPSQGYQSGSSLNLVSTGTPVWIRSNHFNVPTTGRISVTAFLKVDENGQQPPLRIAIEGETQTSTYYRFGAVGSLAPQDTSKQIDSTWRQFAVHFDDLPADRIRELRIGFDLMGEGSVRIDNVAVRDRWFDENDAKAMTQMLAGAVPLVDQPGSYESCRRILESYWPRFLDRYIEVGPNASPDRSPNASLANGSPATDSGGLTGDQTPNGDNIFKRVKSSSPSLLRRWRSNSLQR